MTNTDTASPTIPPPRRLCLLRLSALGDVCHALPVVRTLQAHWPECQITWVIGKLEHQLVGDIDGIEFIVFDKSLGWRAYPALRRQLAGRRFDILLHMQTSARANLAALLIAADIKLGYDRTRAREGHGWVVNRRIAPAARGQHQIDAMFGFAQALGINRRELRWDIPIPEQARAFCRQRLPDTGPVLAISPCSSPSKRVHRDWHAAGYAQVADYAVAELGYQVVLCGGPSERERTMGQRIRQAMRQPALDLTGQTSLKELAAVLARAEVLLSSDSGPAHIATAMGTPVLGLYAATNPYQTGPYLSLEHCVNHYPQAIAREYGKPPEALPWGIRAHGPEAMASIQPAEVIERLHRLTLSLRGKNASCTN